MTQHGAGQVDAQGLALAGGAGGEAGGDATAAADVERPVG
jgi:hypothetical protein